MITDPEKWAAVAARLRSAGEFALDTETYGQPDRTSPQYRARVHCWSVAWPTAARSPRGFRVPAGVVLPRAALDEPGLRAALADPALQKWAHNAPHDHHALLNEGLEVGGLNDTLQWLRVAVPGRREYGLKAVETWLLGLPPRPDFLHVVSYPKRVSRSTWKAVTRCVCGKTPCRARSDSEWFDDALGWFRPHERQQVRVETVHEREVAERYEVTDFVPGAVLEPRMFAGDVPPRGRGIKPEDRFVEVDRMKVWDEYSLRDALSGMMVADWLKGRPEVAVPYPWTRRAA